MKPLAGIRIADFTVHNAGPFCTHMLSQLGAEIIKIESAVRPDAFRKPHPVYGREGPATFDQVASAKLSVRINLKKPAGIVLAKRLVAVSDVAAESFRPGVMERLGLGYDQLKSVNPGIVMLSVSSCGQTGPDSHFAGYAPLFGAWGGLSDLSGYADGPPIEMRHVMDHTVGLHSAVALMAALQQRKTTGAGCHLDVAAREVASSLIGEALLMAAAGATPARSGNDPDVVYQCAGKDRWLSVAIRSAAQRAAFDRLTCGDPEGWARTQDANAAATLLQGLGIAAHASWTTPEIAADAHLRERRSIIDVAEPDGTSRAAVGVPMRLSKSPDIGIHRGTPRLGEDEDNIYGSLLGMSDAERQQLEDAEVIF